MSGRLKALQGVPQCFKGVLGYFPGSPVSFTRASEGFQEDSGGVSGRFRGCRGVVHEHSTNQ